VPFTHLLSTAALLRKGSEPSSQGSRPKQLAELATESGLRERQGFHTQEIPAAGKQHPRSKAAARMKGRIRHCSANRIAAEDRRPICTKSARVSRRHHASRGKHANDVVPLDPKAREDASSHETRGGDERCGSCPESRRFIASLRHHTSLQYTIQSMENATARCAKDGCCRAPTCVHYYVALCSSVDEWMCCNTQLCASLQGCVCCANALNTRLGCICLCFSSSTPSPPFSRCCTLQRVTPLAQRRAAQRE
jgi:hypothetical protein